MTVPSCGTKSITDVVGETELIASADWMSRGGHISSTIRPGNVENR